MIESVLDLLRAARLSAASDLERGRRRRTSRAGFAGRKVGVKQVANTIWLVSFMH